MTPSVTRCAPSDPHDAFTTAQRRFSAALDARIFAEQDQPDWTAYYGRLFWCYLDALRGAWQTMVTGP